MAERPGRTGIYEIRVEDGRLTGTQWVESHPDATLVEFTGERAPRSPTKTTAPGGKESRWSCSTARTWRAGRP